LRKKIKQKLMLTLLPPLVWLVTTFLFWSLRKEFKGHEELQERLRAGKQFVGVCWHSRSIILPRHYHWVCYRPISVLVSQSFDGRFAGALLAQYGFTPIYGSSSRGGKEGQEEMIASGRQGHCLCLTVDGPRGPAEEMKPGAVRMAAGTGYPIVPFSCYADKVTRLRSWDRMVIPHPFARAIFIIGKAIWVPADADEATIEAKRVEAETELKRITAEAESFFNLRDTILN